MSFDDGYLGMTAVPCMSEKTGFNPQYFLILPVPATEHSASDSRTAKTKQHHISTTRKGTIWLDRSSIARSPRTFRAFPEDSPFQRERDQEKNRCIAKHLYCVLSKNVYQSKAISFLMNNFINYLKFLYFLEKSLSGLPDD